MICRACGIEFDPDPDVERLMMLKQIEQICDKCAHDTAPMTPPPSKVPTSGVGAQLYRVESYAASGKLLRHVALPIRRGPPKLKPLRKPRKSDVSVFVMSEGSRQYVTYPPVRLSSNIETFEEQKADLWVRKTPDFWDATTGVSRIDVPYSQIADIKRQPGSIELHLQDGAFVRLRFR